MLFNLHGSSITHKNLGNWTPQKFTTICPVGMWWDMRNVTTLHDTQFIYFNCHHSKASKNPHAGFPLNWYIGSLALLLHWSNVRRHSLKPPVRPKQWATKVRHKTIYHRVLSPPTPGEEVWLGQQDNINYIHAKVQVLSCHGSRDLRWKFGNCVKWSLFSHPITWNDYHIA